MKTSLAFLAAVACFNQADATILLGMAKDLFLHAPVYSTPNNLDNVCSTEQQRGWDFEDLMGKQEVKEYQGFSMQGFSSGEEEVPEKRSFLGRRTFKKHLSCACQQTVAKAPSISGKKGFSIKDVKVSCAQEGNLKLSYTMPNGKSCETFAGCGPRMSTVSNDQCGGATKVSFVFMNAGLKSKIKEMFGKCSINVYQIIWNCGKNKPSPPRETVTRSRDSTITRGGTTVVQPSSPGQTVTRGGETIVQPFPPGQTVTRGGETIVQPFPPGQTVTRGGETIVQPFPPGQTVTRGGETIVQPSPPGQTVTRGGETIVQPFPPGQTVTRGGETIVQPFPPGQTVTRGGETIVQPFPPGQTVTRGGETIVQPPPPGQTITRGGDGSTTCITTSIVTCSAGSPSASAVPECAAVPSGSTSAITKTGTATGTNCPANPTGVEGNPPGQQPPSPPGQQPPSPSGQMPPSPPGQMPPSPPGQQPPSPPGQQPPSPSGQMPPSPPGQMPPSPPGQQPPSPPGQMPPSPPGQMPPSPPGQLPPSPPGQQPPSPPGQQPPSPPGQQPPSPSGQMPPSPPGQMPPSPPGQQPPSPPGQMAPSPPGQMPPSPPGQLPPSPPGQQPPSPPGQQPPSPPGQLPPSPPGQMPPSPPGQQPPSPPGQMPPSPPGQQTPPGGQPPAGNLPCPTMVPSCINTFLTMDNMGTKCKNNLDVECFCSKEKFTQVLYSCFYARRESDDEFIKAQLFLQGMCAQFIPKNPNIATGGQAITSIITVTGTPRYDQDDYTTVMFPNTISEGSTTKVVTSTLAIPNIVLPTSGPGAPTGVPGSLGTDKTGSPSGSGTGTGRGDASPGNPISPPGVRGTGTGGIAAPTGSGFPVTAGATRIGVSLGAGLAIMAAVIAI